MSGPRNVGINIFANEPPDPTQGTGQVFWVGRTATVPGGVAGVDNAGNFGSSPQRPFATLDYALSFCTASQGDTIYLLPQHAETVAAASDFTIDVAGVSIIGLGRGTDRPQFTVDVTGSTVTSANVLIKNIMFTAGASGVAIGLAIAAAYCELDSVEFGFDVATDDFVIHLEVDNVDHAYIHHCRFIAEPATAGANTAFRLDEADWIRIEDNYITGDYAVAAINGVSAASLQGMILRNYIYNDDASAAENAIDLDVASTGIIAYNTIGSAMTTTVIDLIDPGSMRQIENYGNNDVNTIGVLIGAGLDT